MPKAKQTTPMDLEDTQEEARKGFEDLSASFDRGKPGISESSKGEASSSPVKEKLEQLKRLRAAPAASSAPSQPDQSAVVLDAIAAMSNKLDKMALKSDIDVMQENMAKVTREMISEAVDPIKDEIHDIKSRISKIESHERPDKAHATGPTRTSADVIKFMNDNDPAHKRIVFIGFPDSASADARIQAVENHLAQHLRGMRVSEVENFSKGPYNDRKLTNVAYAGLSSRDAAKRALTILDSVPFIVDGSNIKIKAARSQLNSQRNVFINKAHDMIKGSELSKQKSVKIEWKERQVTVIDIVAFSQDKSELHGTFRAPYAELVF